jgi:hypothetical protein
MGVANATLNDLKQYYAQREELLAKETGTTVEDLKTNINKVFNNFTALYEQNIDNSSFGVLDNLAKARATADKLDKLVADPEAVRKSIKNMVTEIIKEIGGAKPNKNAKFKNESLQLNYATASFIAFFAQQHNIDPLSILEEATAFMVYGKKPRGGLSARAESFFQLLEKAEPSVKKVMQRLQIISYPNIKEQSKKNNKGDARKDVFSLVSTNHGFGAEAYVTDLLSSMINTGQFNIINAVGNAFDISKDTTGSISDTAFNVTINNTTMRLGVDIKATSSKNIIPGKLKYKRGEFGKKMSEIFEMLDNKTATIMMYLIANSYFFRGQTEEDSYEKYIGTGREIYTLLNAFRALYALLPPGQAVAANAADVGNMVKTDDRFVVIIDGTVYLMTEFLNEVSDYVLQGIRGGKGENIALLEDNLKTILDNFNTAVGGVSNQLYTDKLNTLNKKFKSVSSRKGAKAYSTLYNDLIMPR